MNASWEIIWKTDETKQKTQKEKPEEDEQTEDRATGFAFSVLWVRGAAHASEGGQRSGSHKLLVLERLEEFKGLTGTGKARKNG